VTGLKQFIHKGEYVKTVLFIDKAEHQTQIIFVGLI
jgi:hypothetical protein